MIAAIAIADLPPGAPCVLMFSESRRLRARYLGDQTQFHPLGERPQWQTAYHFVVSDTGGETIRRFTEADLPKVGLRLIDEEAFSVALRILRRRLVALLPPKTYVGEPLGFIPQGSWIELTSENGLQLYAPEGIFRLYRAERSPQRHSEYKQMLVTGFPAPRSGLPLASTLALLLAHALNPDTRIELLP